MEVELWLGHPLKWRKLVEKQPTENLDLGLGDREVKPGDCGRVSAHRLYISFFSPFLD